MPERRLFNRSPSDDSFNLGIAEEVRPNRGEMHPALCVATELDPKENSKSVNDADVQVTPQITEINSAVDGNDSEVNSIEVLNFFSVSNQKLPYTKDEDEVILKYVLKGENIFKVSSVLLWKHLEAKKKNPKRTYHSLKNRFLRNIKPVIFSSFGYLIKDQTTTNNILAKFPELKQKMGQRQTLPRLKVPERPRITEEYRLSSTSADAPCENIERATPLRLLNPNDGRNAVVQPEAKPVPCPPPNALSPDVFNPVVYGRVVRVEGDDITVCVNFKRQRHVETPFSSTTLGIYEKFRRLERKNKLVLCPRCGVFSRRKRVTPLAPSNQMEFLIPNSIESPEMAVKNTVASRLNSRTDKQKKINTSSESLSRSPGSPSLLVDISEAYEEDTWMAGVVTENKKEAGVVRVSNSVGPSVSANEVEGTNKVDETSKATQPGQETNNVTRSMSRKTRAPRRFDLDTEGNKEAGVVQASNIVGLRVSTNEVEGTNKVDETSKATQPTTVSRKTRAPRRFDLDTEGNKEAGVVQASNIVGLRVCANEVEGTSKVDETSKATEPGQETDNFVTRRVPRKTRASSSRSDIEVPQPSKRLREDDLRSDSICEEAMADFRKLMDCEEEQLLVEKCLNRDLKRIGLEPVSQTNWDSYLLESSMDMDTPSLTIDYTSETDTKEVTTQCQDTSSSSAAENNRMVLRERARKSS